MAEFGLPAYDAQMLTSDPALARLFEAAAALCARPKETANWIMGETMKAMKQAGLEPRALRLTPENLAEIVEAVEGGKINRASGRIVFAAAFEGPIDTAAFIESHGMAQVSDAGLIEAAVREVLEKNPQSVQDFHSGKEKARGFLMGQAMRVLRGRADPQAVERELRAQLAAE